MSIDSTHEPLRVLAVDDSAVFRRILGSVLKEIPDAVLSDTARDGRSALKRIDRGDIDFAILDIEMPEFDGLETLKEIQAHHPELGVVMLTGVTEHSAALTMRALELGALDFFTKGGPGNAQENHKHLVHQLSAVMHCFETQRTLRRLRNRTMVSDLVGPASGGRVSATSPNSVKPLLASQHVIGGSLSADSARARPAKLLNVGVPTDVLVIGCSTGGPQALAEVIPSLPHDLGVPVLVVQHMPPVFTASLAQSIAKRSKLKVDEARKGQIVTPGTVYIAPGGHHMVVRQAKTANGRSFVQIELNDNPPENSCRPSVDVLLRSIATIYGDRVLTVIMTGMGEDGLRGVKVLKQQGSRCLTQDAESCVVYGMPRAIDQAGLSDECVALANMATRIASIVRRQS